ncbi:MAG: hypothetical protein LC720_07185, partial [Actinobacteria bacterium]|nr:hypothetical protein [Actinomycetota bacterium]
AAEELGIDLSGVRAAEDEVPDPVLEEAPEAPEVPDSLVDALLPDDDEDALGADMSGVVDTPLDLAAVADPSLDLKSLDAEDTLDEETT